MARQFRVRSVPSLIPTLLLCCVVAACGNRAPDVTAQLEQVLAAGGASSARDKDVWADVRKFYSARTNEPVWVSDDGPVRASGEVLKALDRATEHGLDPEKYGAKSLRSEWERLSNAKAPDSTAPALARFEADLTAALLALGREVAIGRPGPPPTGVVVRKDGRRTPPDFAARLAAIVDEAEFGSWPDDVRPTHPQYAALQQAMKALVMGAASVGGATPVATTTPVASATPVAGGTPVAATPVAPLGPTPGAAAGQADKHLIAYNMERWRHMPDNLGERYILVNIPQYHLFVHEGERTVLDSRIIVGKQGDETPIFSADMTQIVFSPYWNIPESISEGETLPAILKNPAYLSKNQIEVLRRTDGKVERVDPSTVNWEDESVVQELSLRQKPGPANALGHVKFLMPNKYSVYLHDTPSDRLFEKVGRAFSHGCVRVGEPVELAKYVLADAPEWTSEKIEAAMHSGDEQVVKIKRPIPVHIVYFTAWVDDTGNVQVFKDVYGRDR